VSRVPRVDIGMSGQEVRPKLFELEAGRKIKVFNSLPSCMVSCQNNARVEKVHKTTCNGGAGRSAGYLAGVTIAPGAFTSDH